MTSMVGYVVFQLQAQLTGAGNAWMAGAQDDAAHAPRTRIHRRRAVDEEWGRRGISYYFWWLF